MLSSPWIPTITPSNSAGIDGSEVLPKLAPLVTMVVAKAVSAWATLAVASIVRPSRLTDLTWKPWFLSHCAAASVCARVGPKRRLNSSGVSHRWYWLEDEFCWSESSCSSFA